MISKERYNKKIVQSYFDPKTIMMQAGRHSPNMDQKHSYAISAEFGQFCEKYHD